MEAKELRIGNTILYKVKIIDISMVGLFQLYHVSDNHADSKTDNLQYEPIPLTEEWLLRLGFEKENATYIKKGSLRLFKNTCRDASGDFDGYCENRTVAICRYVHQLQNLYFALTGLELEYEQN